MSVFYFEKPRCVFIRTRKTGSTSVVNGMFGGRCNVNLAIDNGEWDDYFDNCFIFTFVRNPFDRLISCFRMFQAYSVNNNAELGIQQNLSIDFILDVVEDETIGLDGNDFLSKLRLHAIPLMHDFYNIDKAKYIGRFENFKEDYRTIASYLNVFGDTIPHCRKNAKVDFRTWYTPQTRGRAEKIFKEDCRRFSYSFD